MAKVTSKLQVTVPKAIADRFGIRPGDDIEWRAERLRSFDEATARQRARDRSGRHKRSSDRGWTRGDLYNRVRPR